MENYFGRMANVFRIVRVRFPFTFEYVNPYLKALCFLTNVNVYMSPLREDDFKLHRALIEYTRNKNEGKKKKHRSQQSGNNQNTVPTSSPSSSPFCASLPQNVVAFIPKRTPSSDSDDE